MAHRILAAVLTVTITMVLTPAIVVAQSPPRTAWGAPDLQGIWNNSTLTPFQRPAELGEREFLSEEEAASVEQRAANRNLATRTALRCEQWQTPMAVLTGVLMAHPGRTTTSGWSAAPRLSPRNAHRSSWTRQTDACQS